MLDYKNMVSKCANHDCTEPFRYFNQGRLFQFPRNRNGIQVDHPQAWNGTMESFWLCGVCARALTLVWKREGIVAVPLPGAQPFVVALESAPPPAVPAVEAPATAGARRRSRATRPRAQRRPRHPFPAEGSAPPA